MRTIGIALMTVLASQVSAGESRQLGSHEHGVGALNIAVDGTTVAMEFHAPGADIVGFEYAATSAEDRAAVDSAVATLAKPLDLFVMPEAAACSVVQASASLESEAMEDDHDDHDHGHKHDHDHGHDHDKHAHDDHSDAAQHTEFHAEYTLNCANPSALDTITFAYFDMFENARELEVQILSASGAQAFDVERGSPQLDLRGMF